MQPAVNIPRSPKSGWVYVSLTVVDGDRQLTPSHVSFDHLHFPTPPRLTSNCIHIIVVNGDSEQRHTAVVRPHDVDATRIPIELLPMAHTA